MWFPSIAASSVQAGQQGVWGRSTLILMSPVNKEAEEGKDDTEMSLRPFTLEVKPLTLARGERIFQ